MIKNLILVWCCIWSSYTSATCPVLQERKPEAGMIYFASYGNEATREVLESPYIIGALYTIVWTDIESEKGKYDWKKVDDFVEQWVQVGKKVALRIMWSGSGYWRNPIAATPTPGWVWKEGAKYAFHPDSKTEIPIFWDPIYRKHAMNFLSAINNHFADNSNILFIDITPGAETNPYRFGTINKKDPGFKKIFVETKASDGRTYSEMIWKETILNWITETAKIVTDLPCLVTLNQGSLYDSSNFMEFGQCAVNHGMYVGQNGLKEGSYDKDDNFRKELFYKWGKSTKLFFEMVHAAETMNTGSMMGVIEAARRIGCSYLNVYAVDVAKSSPGTKEYVSKWEEDLKIGAEWFKYKSQGK